MSSVLFDKPGTAGLFSSRLSKEPMAKEELLEMNGVVAEVLPDSRYRVTLDNGHKLVAYSAGKMRKHHIRIIEKRTQRVVDCLPKAILHSALD